MTVKIFKSYFRGFHEIVQVRKNSKSQNILAALKIFSYFLVLPPIGFGVAYGCYKLYGRVSHKKDTVISESDKEIKAKAQEQLPKSKVSGRHSATVETVPSEKKTIVESTPSAENEDVLPPVGSNPNIFQTPETRIVHGYTGDLTPDEKAKIKQNFKDDFTLNIAFEHSPNINLSVCRKDLFVSGAEVIVNAANTHLGGGGGIDDAIHRNGGKGYADAHKELQKFYKSNFVSGHAAMIESGLLKANNKIDHVIVIAGPSGNPSPEKEDSLYSCYYNSLVLAQAAGKKQIAFPSIGTGIFSFPKDRAAAISLKAVHDFLKAHPNTCVKTISIHFLESQPRQVLEDYFFNI